MNDNQIKQFIELRKKNGDSDDEISAFLRTKGVDYKPTSEGNFAVSFLGKAGKVAGSIIKTIAKPFAETGVGLYNAGETALSGFQKSSLNKSRNLPLLGATKPFMTGSESFGDGTKKILGTGLEIGSNLVGGVGAGQVVKAGLKGAVKQGVKAGISSGFQSGLLSGTGGALKSQAEIGGSGSVIKDTLNAIGKGVGSGIIGAGAGAVFGAAAPLAGKMVKTAISPLKTAFNAGGNFIKGGNKILEKIIKPVGQDVKNGFKIENLNEFKISGNLGDMFEQTQTHIKTQMRLLDDIIVNKSDHPTMPLAEAVNILERKYKNQGLEGLGGKQKALNEVENLKLELASVVPDWENKMLSFSEAVIAKRRAGLQAAFEHDPLKKGVNPQEQVWNDFYGILKDSLEKNAPEQFAEVNKALTKLIPIEQALIRRIPVAERNNVLSLNDVISFSAAAIDPKAAGIAIAQRLLRSGKFAGTLIEGGQKLQGLSSLGKAK